MVIIVGAGPTGLWLASELRLHGIAVTVLDRRAARMGESRAGGLHARSMEILESRGIAGRFVAAGRRVPYAHFAGLWLDLSRLDTRYPYVLGLVQSRIEALLEEHLREHGTEVRWNTEVAAVHQAEGHAEVTTAAGETLRGDYVVGCDGGRSTIRRLLGVAFDGTDATVSSMLADVKLAAPPDGVIFQQRTPLGDFTALQLEPGYHRLMVNRYTAPAPGSDLEFDEFRAVFTAMAGTDYGMHSPKWTSRYHDAARLAAHYRRGRVLLAGDAAHIHWPSGGQGLNTGLQDATNLGWKLAETIRGLAPAPGADVLAAAPAAVAGGSDPARMSAAELNALATGAVTARPHIDIEGLALLDTYEAERRPVAVRVLANTRAQAALSRPGPQADALRATMAELLTVPEVNDGLAAMVAGLDQAEPSRSAFSRA
ncbi:FAD-dependent monooxygenase [Dactylosporangium sp. NPDC049140]|uniref:FAD-dependent monooxygenase n=1 Tax=Dactylosporangium sp. NPDC049140 TaxID=3155647 RepID=UPI0034055C37